MIETIRYLAVILLVFISPPFILHYFYGKLNEGTGSNQVEILCKYWEEYKWNLILAEGTTVVFLAGYLYFSTTIDIEIVTLLVTAYLWSQLFFLGFLVHICKKVRMKNSPPHDANPDRKEQT